MQMQKRYEWDLEALVPDQEDEILDHDFRDAGTMQDLRKHLSRWTPEELYEADNKTMCFVLVLNVGNDDEGLVDRSWAYTQFTEAGEPSLPEYFEDGQRVPKKYREQFAKWAATTTTRRAE
jgi:hypothetical protein